MQTRRFTRGLGGKLLLSFLGIGLFALLAAASGFFSIAQIDKSISTITEERLPQAVSLLDLSRQAERVVRSAPALLVVQTDAEREAVFSEITRQAEQLNALSSDSNLGATDTRSRESVQALVRSLNYNLNQIDSLVRKRLSYTSIMNTHKSKLTRINGVSKRLVAPGLRVLEAQSSSWLRQKISETSEDLSPKQEELAKSIVALVPQQKVGAVLDAVNNGLLEIAVANSVEEVDVLLFPLKRSMAELVEVTETMPTRVKNRLTKQIAILGDLVEGPDSLNKTRQLELNQINQANELLETNTRLALALTDEVNQLVEKAIENADQAKDKANEVQQINTKVLIAVLVLGLVFSFLIIWLYVGRRIISRLSDLIRSMVAIAEGDLRIQLPDSRGNDEITQMEKALRVFRDTAIEVEESNLAEIEEARRRLTDAIENTSEGFAFYDAEDNLVICNTRYRELLSSEVKADIEPGMSFDSIIRQSIDNGSINLDGQTPEQWINQRIETHRSPGEPQLQRRADDTWVLVSERRTGDDGTVAIYSDITDLKQREEELAKKSNALEQLSNQLAKYLSPQVYDSIFSGKQEVRLVSQRKRLSIFFSDLVGFTATTEKMESEDLTHLLNTYLTEMSQIALQYGATIDKYIGDAIVIFFGDPETMGVKEDALACVKMAIAMRKKMLELEDFWRESGVENPLKCRMGINTGMCTVGNFGSEDRMDYTIVGGGVNLASRLESACEPEQILVSYETYAHIKDEIYCEEQKPIELKGLAAPVRTYQVLDLVENLAKSGKSIHSKTRHLQLDVDLRSMSPQELVEAARILTEAAEKIKSSGD